MTHSKLSRLPIAVDEDPHRRMPAWIFRPAGRG
jgi:hypothetical protein